MKGYRLRLWGLKTGCRGIASDFGQQLRQSSMLPGAQQFDRIGAVTLGRVESVQSAFRTLATLAVEASIVMLMEGNEPPIGADRQRWVVGIGPARFAQTV
ncbi:hypothetical protein SAMN05216510_1981 [Pseudomonas coleopterorum]|nr:hypothetical protein SAMN05216510_1981 [Pseudomonas coleopterorum]